MPHNNRRANTNPLPVVNRSAGIAPPHNRRDAHTKTKKHKQENDIRHPLFDYVSPTRRVKSRKSFMTMSSMDPTKSAGHRVDKWNEWDQSHQNDATQSLREEPPIGTNLSKKDWVILNRARAKVGKTGCILHKLGLATRNLCPCGHLEQTMEHILR